MGVFLVRFLIRALLVMLGLDPRIHLGKKRFLEEGWIAGSSPAMTIAGDYAALSRKASSAACTASGVPTCIHTPSSRSPNSRSCSLARSNILVSENSSDGASANSDGDMIAAPAY